MKMLMVVALFFSSISALALDCSLEIAQNLGVEEVKEMAGVRGDVRLSDLTATSHLCFGLDQTQADCFIVSVNYTITTTKKPVVESAKMIADFRFDHECRISDHVFTQVD